MVCGGPLSALFVSIVPNFPFEFVHDAHLLLFFVAHCRRRCRRHSNKRNRFPRDHLIQHSKAVKEYIFRPHSKFFCSTGKSALQKNQKRLWWNSPIASSSSNHARPKVSVLSFLLSVCLPALSRSSARRTAAAVTPSQFLRCFRQCFVRFSALQDSQLRR